MMHINCRMCARFFYIITKSMRALWLVNQLWVIVPVNQGKNRVSPELLYLTIIRRRRSEYWWIFPETKSRGIFTNIQEPEANNCFSIITRVIIEIPKQGMLQFYHNLTSYHAAHMNVSHNAFLNSRSEEKKHFLWHLYRVKTNHNVVL